MSNQSSEASRDGRVILAWIILALQIIGLLWLLLFARDRLAAFSSQARTAEVAQATAAATEEATMVPAVDTAATEAAAEAATRAITDAAATAEAEAVLAAATATVEAAPAVTAAAEAAATDSTGLLPEEVTVDTTAIEAAGVAAEEIPAWVATLVPGAAADTAAGRPALPPHLLLLFIDPQNPTADPAVLPMIDLNQPQVRIIPVATLLSLLEQNGDAAGQDALDELFSLLEQQPDPAEAGVPVAPVLGEAVQNFVTQTDYRSFGGGEGIGYITNITGEDVVPVTNESGLNYVYQGVTADGEQYVFMSWPLDADFLPATTADADDAAAMLAADPDSYFDALSEQVNTGVAGLRPSLRLLTGLVSALSIRGQVTTDDEGAPVAGSAAEAVGFQWNWTSRADAGGVATPVEEPQNYTLVMWPDGTYNIKAYCNVGGGAFTYDDGGMIRFEPGPLSMALCPSGSRDTEFVQGLLAARALGFDESGDMILELEDGSRLTLANVGEAEVADVAAAEDQPAAADSGLTGLVLQWPGFSDGAGQTVIAENPENYTITFLPDGTFTIEADCNVGGGAYVFGDDGALQLGPIRLTRAQCAAGSLDNEFVTFLERVSSATVGDDGAVTLTTTDGGSASFVNIGPVADSGAASETTGAAADDPAAAQQNDLLGVVWQWSDLTPADGTAAPVEDPATYTLTLLDDGTYAFRADCNNGSGSYTLDGMTLALLPGAMTLAACDADSRSDEFAGYLGQVTSYAFDSEGLALTLADGGTLTFVNDGPFVAGAAQDETTAADDPLATSLWLWAHFRDAKQDYDVSGDYFIAFNADGSVGVTADCNAGVGTYRVDGDALTISLGPSTLVACADGSLSSSFLDYLSQAGTFAIGDDGTLVIELMADGGTMTLVPAP